MRLQCALLGLVQGITEFLPVSSSGHLVIVQELLGWSDPALSFDVMLHLSTMTATLLFFRKEVVRIARDWFSGLFSIRDRDLPGWRYGWSVILGTLVTVFIALLSRPLAEVLFSSPLFAGFALIITGFVLRYGSRIVPRDLPVSLSTGIKVGLAQGLSILPGISRSGMTIVTGLRCGLSPREAFSFSFLLSLPAILGATVLEVVKAGGVSEVVTSLPTGWWIGMATAFASGLFALGILRRVVIRGRLGFFAVYWIAAGLFVVFLNLIGG